MSSTHMIRASEDAHQKLRVLSFMNGTSMTVALDKVVNKYIETGMESSEQGSMWRIMSGQMTQAREGGKDR